jgi:hypothetical protein
MLLGPTQLSYAVGKLEGIRALERSNCRRLDSIKLERMEMEYECVDWIYVTQDRVPPSSRADTVINLVVV